MNLRPLARRSDDDAVRRIFRSTLGLGRPVPFPLPGLARYEALCLDWYLGPGRADAAVVDGPDGVVGYVLVCTEPDDHAAVQRDEALRFALWASPRVAARRIPDPARTFWRLRLLDGWDAWRRTGDRRPVAHAHINLDPAAKTTGASLEVLRHIDERVGGAGHLLWQGEINARRGRRAVALQRVVGDVVDAVPNRTYTWLAGRPVNRLTVERHVDAVAPSISN